MQIVFITTTAATAAGLTDNRGFFPAIITDTINFVHVRKLVLFSFSFLQSYILCSATGLQKSGGIDKRTFYAGNPDNSANFAQNSDDEHQ
ncbi:MAG: hypothetical protein K2K55_09390 [Duncaniella sp.]|nr:hypothetical protein [Duncaniella sp.]